MRIHIKSLDEESQAQIIKDYRSCGKFSDVARKWNVDFRTIRDFIKTEDVTLIPKKMNITKDIEDAVVNSYENGDRLYKIHEITKVPYRKILNIIKSRDIQLTGNRWYKYNKNFFDIVDTEEKAYWLGFIYADGGVYSDGGKINTLTIKLAKKDVKHLEKLKSTLGATNPIKFRTVTKCMPNGKVGTFYSAMLRFTSKHIFETMCKHGCVPNKSLVTEFPSNGTIPEWLVCHFIRGYFDGDGCITINKKNNQPHFSILGSRNFLLAIQSIFVNARGLSLTKLSKPSAIHRMSYGGRLNCLAIRDYLYKDATIYLDRKYKIFYCI
jgi:intein-encoded DNA endonuclease-like protein